MSSQANAEHELGLPTSPATVPSQLAKELTADQIEVETVKRRKWPITPAATYVLIGVVFMAAAGSLFVRWPLAPLWLIAGILGVIAINTGIGKAVDGIYKAGYDKGFEHGAQASRSAASHERMLDLIERAQQYQPETD